MIKDCVVLAYSPSLISSFRSRRWGCSL
uniref:Uncharacterized protein n=1 Tax=Rhizophora mucronata TaxID=61149 RepID=A0A2P2L7H4_RHIMU